MSLYVGRRLLRSRSWKIPLILITVLIIYIEYLSYALHKWPLPECESSNCIKLLLVSDPQLLGEQMSRGSVIIEALERWDCDRFLSKTFHMALKHFNPDVVIFLGDLMDEGSIATNAEFARYLLRFKHVFRTKDRPIIYVPGDNDIGGEHNEIIRPDIVERYQESFNQRDIVRFRDFDFFKVNRLTYGIPKPLDVVYYNSTRIVLSHMPLLFLPMPFVKKCVDQLRPQLIFSGHQHKAIRITADVETGKEKLVKAMLPNEGPIWKFKLNDIIVHEVMVPTCSYRMGVPDVGYGAAVLDAGNNAMWYTIFWLPSRFVQLYIYAVMGLVGALVASMYLLYSLGRWICHPKRCR